MNPKEKLEEIEKGKNEIYNFWKVRGYEEVRHCLGMNISLHKKEPYEHLGLCLQYLEQFKREILEESKNKLTKISDFIDALEDQSNNWDKLCDCPASENPMNHEKDCMTIKIRKDISELNL